MTQTSLPRGFGAPKALLLVAALLGGAAFAAGAQGFLSQAGPPSAVQNPPPPADGVRPLPAERGDSEDEADDERAVETAVVGEAAPPEAEQAKPAQVEAVSAAAANKVAAQTKQLEGLSLWKKAKLSGKGDALGYFADAPGGKQVRLSVEPAAR